MDSNSEANSSDKIREELLCPVCRNPPVSVPIYQCRAGHLVCKDCFPKLNNCGICRVKLTPSIRSLIAEKVLTEFQVKCKFQQNGCTTESGMQKIFAHERECLHRVIECSTLGLQYEDNKEVKELEKCRGFLTLSHILRHLGRCHMKNLLHSKYVHCSKVQAKIKVLQKDVIRFPSNILRFYADQESPAFHAFVLMLRTLEDGCLDGSINYLGTNYNNEIKMCKFDPDTAYNFNYEVLIQNPEENNVRFS